MMEEGYHVLSASPIAVEVEAQIVSGRRLDADYHRPAFIQNERRIRRCGYPVSKLSELWVEGRYGTLPDSADYNDDGVLLIRGGDFRDLAVLPNEQLVRVPETYWYDTPKAQASPGDILLLAKGASIDGVNSVAIYPPGLDKALVNGSIFRIIPKPSIDGGYLAVFMATPTFLLQKRRAISNTGIFYNEFDAIAGFFVPVPPRPVQEYIGAKVRLAERCRLRASELWTDSAQMLSQGTGISLETEHFEHVDEKRLRTASYQLVGASPMQIWVRQDLVEHELGPQYFHPRRANVILKLRTSDIELKRLTDLTSRIADRMTPERITEVPYYVGLADIDTTTGYFEQKETAQGDILGTSALFKANDILFSKLRPYLNKVAICPAHIPQACGSTELLVYRAHRTTLPYYIFFMLKSNFGLFQILDVTTGSTLPRVDPEIVDDILVPMIAREAQLAIDRNVRTALHLRHQASQLVSEAKADVEALIEGRLDVDGIMAGRVRPPTWEEIEV